MSPNFIYCICGMGMAAYATFAISMLSRYKWTYPYKWFIAFFFYWALYFFSFFPFLEQIYGVTCKHLIVILISSGLPPFTIFLCARISYAIKRIRLDSAVTMYVPFLASRLCFYYMSDNLMVNILLMVSVIILAIYSFIRIINRVNDYNHNVKNYVTDLDYYSNKGIKRWSVCVMVVVIMYSCIYFALDVLKILDPHWSLLIDVFILLPLFVTFKYKVHKQHWFECFELEYAPGFEFTDTFFLPSRYERKQQKSWVSENRKLKHSQGSLGNMDESKIISDDSADTKGQIHATEATSHEIFNQIESKLSFLESHDTFYITQGIRVDQVAKLLGVDKVLFTDYLHSRGTTFYDYISELRVVFSVLILDRTPNQTNDEIAVRCGFTSTDEYIRRFKIIHHITPDEYRQDLQA